VNSFDILELRRLGIVTVSEPSPWSRPCEKDIVVVRLVGVDGPISSSMEAKIITDVWE